MLESSKNSFHISHHVNFGDSLYVYGQLEELGEWRRGRAHRMEWSEGDSWNLCLDIPVNGTRLIEYDYFVARTNDPNDVVKMERGLCRVALLRKGENTIGDVWDQLQLNLTIMLPKTFPASKEMYFMIKTKEFSDWCQPFAMPLTKELKSSVSYSKLLSVYKSVRKVYIQFFVRKSTLVKEKNEFDRNSDLKIDLAGFLGKTSALKYKKESLNLDLNIIRIYKVFKAEFNTYRYNQKIIFGPLPNTEEEWNLVERDCEFVVTFLNDKYLKLVRDVISSENEKADGKSIGGEKNLLKMRCSYRAFKSNREVNVLCFNYLEKHKKAQKVKTFCRALNSLLKDSKACVYIAWNDHKNFVLKAMTNFIMLRRNINVVLASKIIKNCTMLETIPEHKAEHK